MIARICLALSVSFAGLGVCRGNETLASAGASSWPQWRGPQRDGRVSGAAWPDRLGERLTRVWRVPLGPSYSGPILAGDLVIATETRDKEVEIVHAFDRGTGGPRWQASWKGAISVPFFAASNGSWIRSTPAYDGQCLYVAGMRDVLVCLDAAGGGERWRVDFVQQLSTPLPAFGFVSSPLVDGDALYVQAGGSVVRLKKDTGEILWRALDDGGGMFGSAFSSPTIAVLAGKRQLLVQTRERLAGVDLESSKVLWSQEVPSFRGMNILTPTALGDAVFTSSYRNRSWLYTVSRAGDSFQVAETWSNNAAGYMSTPVVIGDHLYLHLQNQRFACMSLATGERTWTSPTFGKYCSLIAQGDRILALDQRGELLLIQADPAEFKLLDALKISDAETWAHLAVDGESLFIRELDGLAACCWK